jgi:ribonuclease J
MNPDEGSLRIIPLGGLGEIGLNMTLFELSGKTLIVDCGLMFPSDEMLGVDIVIPDFNCLADRNGDLLGLVLTHGHEDHIGAVPYLLKQYPMPVYGTRLTLALLAEKLREFKIEDIPLHVFAPGDELHLGDFELGFVRVGHSIPDGVCLAIQTPAGLIVHSGDFKLDFDPEGEHTTDLRELGRLGDRGVRCLLSDSTNVEQIGYTLSESEVGRALESVFRDAGGRIIVTLFASNIARIQQVFNIAEGFGRKVCLSGKSMISTVSIARQLGYLKVSDAQLLEVGQLSQQSKKRTVLLTTGSQGEPMSALTRIATGSHKQIQIVPGDTVVLSSKFIPGNEVTIAALINELFNRGAKVVYETIGPIHTSGHAHREELKLMLKLIRPQYFIPIHGETRHLVQHRDLAADMGVKPENLLLVKNGDIIQFDESGARLAGNLPTCRVFVDGKGVGDVGNIVLTDRRLLSESGVVTCIIIYDEATGEILDGPRLVSRGVVYVPDFSELFDEASERARICFQAICDRGLLGKVEAKEMLGRELKRVFKKRIRRRPVVMPVMIPLNRKT